MLGWDSAFRSMAPTCTATRTSTVQADLEPVRLAGCRQLGQLHRVLRAHGLQARLTVQWQGEQLLQLGQEQSGGAFGDEPVYQAASTEVDFSTQYQITSHFTCTLRR